MSTIIYGPAGSGKTKHAARLKSHFMCNAVVDNATWPATARAWATLKAGNDLLLITATEVPQAAYRANAAGDRRIMHIEDALAELAPTEDLVNHPAHYATSDNGIECIDAIRAALGREQFIGFLRGQVLKYTWRLGKKDDAQQDNAKALWYATKLAEVLAEEGRDD